MATATATAKNNKTKKKGAKAQPQIYTFTWKGLNRDGKQSSGELRGASIAEIKTLLKSQGINPKTVRKKSASLFGGDKKIKAMDIAVITRQIATMLAAGVPLVTSIELIARGHEKNRIRVLLGTVLADVQAGIPLSDALRLIESISMTSMSTWSLPVNTPAHWMQSLNVSPLIRKRPRRSSPRSKRPCSIRPPWLW